MMHMEPLPFREQLQARILNGSEAVRLGAPFLLSIVLDTLVAYYEELNRLVQAEIERLEERALHESTETFFGRSRAIQALDVRSQPVRRPTS
jgi:Mg2+ and Co2+ transporter CorA